MTDLVEPRRADPFGATASLHRTLERQLRRLGVTVTDTPIAQAWGQLLELVSNAYTEADNDRYMLERSIEVSSIEMRGLYDKLIQQAHTDGLTGLPNRTDLMRRIDASLLQLAHTRSVAILFVDLDGFKLVNDTFGHAFGDELLVQAAARIRATIRTDDDIARLGGDEFVVICRAVEHPDTAEAIASRVVAAISHPFCVAGESVHISASIGLASADASSRAEDLVRRADLAMYAAKAQGRSRWVCFDEQMQRDATDRLAIETDLRMAIANGELMVHLQPVITLANGAPTGAEALVRWARPGHGFVPPDQFVPIAEESTLIHALSAEVLRLACTAAASWVRDDMSIGVNLSARDLHNDDLLAMIESVTAATGVAPRRLVVELTESSVLVDGPVVLTNLAKLRALGVTVAIDDFGKDYSSLSYLRRLPVSTLKIDKTFVDDVDTDPIAAAIVRAIIEMGHAIGLKVIAEGVERATQSEELARLGCDAAQGYYLCRPSTPQALALQLPEFFRAV